MGRSTHCTPEQRKLIKKLIAEGKTYKFIQDVLGCSAKMVRNAIIWQPKPDTRGRKRKTTVQDDRKIVRLAKKEPFATSSKIKQDLNLQVSSVTVRRRLREAKLYGRAPRTVPKLTQHHIQRRLQFAKTHIDWPASKWRNILWSDESKIVLFGSSGRRQYARKPPASEFSPRFTLKTVKHGGAKIMIWACFSYYGTGPIYWIKPVMDQYEYLKILTSIMLPYAEEEMPLKWVFMHDNDPKHSSRRVKEWLQSAGIEVLNWPAQSPDLNPIENLWTDVKNAVFHAKPTTTEHLWDVVQRTWQSIPIERCQRLVDSMPRRCHAVISNKGHAIPY